MRTCKYCASPLKFIGEKDKQYFYCSHCELPFEVSDTCMNQKRLSPIPEVIDDMAYLSKSTKELLKEKTITLFYYLKACRSDWYHLKETLDRIYDIRNKEDVSDLYKSLYEEYDKLTKKRFVLENILLERNGYVPKKLTNDFLDQLISDGSFFGQKSMYIYINGGAKHGNRTKKQPS